MTFFRCGQFTTLTWSASQHTGPVLHFSPQMATSFVLVSSFGCSARPLSRQGSCPPKKDCLPHWPRIAHLPSSCRTVQASSLARTAGMRIASTDAQRPGRSHPGCKILTILYAEGTKPIRLQEVRTKSYRWCCFS